MHSWNLNLVLFTLVEDPGIHKFRNLVKFDNEYQNQSTPKIICILTHVFYTFGPNLVILAWMGKLLCRQARNCTTHAQTAI